MIHLSYYILNDKIKKETYDLLLQTLPPFIQNKILKFRFPQDAERSLAGNILLMRGLQSLGLTKYDLRDLKYSEFQKPYFDDAISFNISHSGQYVICAISETYKVGVDVEGVKDMPMEDFTNLFAKQEWAEVLNCENKLHAFYTLWVKKEAFLKALGCGLNLPLNEIVILDNKIKWEDKEWFLHEVKFDPDHIAYICCDVVSPLVQARQIFL